MLDINPRTYCTKEDKAKGRKEKSSKRGEHQFASNDFIQEVLYTTWLANVVMIKKKVVANEKCALTILISTRHVPKMCLPTLIE